MEEVWDPWHRDWMCQSVSGPSGGVLWRGLCHPAWAFLCQPAHACPWLHCQSLHWPAQQLWYILIRSFLKKNYLIFDPLLRLFVLMLIWLVALRSVDKLLRNCWALFNIRFEDNECFCLPVSVGSSSSNHFSTPRQSVLPPLPLSSLSGTQLAHRSPPSTHWPVWIFHSSLNKGSLAAWAGLYSSIAQWDSLFLHMLGELARCSSLWLEGRIHLVVSVSPTSCCFALNELALSVCL